ncbi:MAG: radical SAM protein, partial [Tannerella sp.]|nr:radical SAM protein [Tannerella sp.]
VHCRRSLTCGYENIAFQAKQRRKKIITVSEKNNYLCRSFLVVNFNNNNMDKTQIENRMKKDNRTLSPDRLFPVGDYQVYDGCNFSISLTHICNADCTFCIEKLKYMNRAEGLTTEIIENVSDYVFQNIQQKQISITGGEPLRSDSLEAVLMVSQRFKKSVLTTNGTTLWEKLPLLYKYDLKHLNVSRVSINQKKNADIMKFPFYKDDFGLSLQEVSRIKIPVRMSCLLLREGVDTIDMIKEYVDYYAAFGVKSFVFRELTSVSTSMVSENTHNYLLNNKIWLKTLDFSEFEHVSTRLGYYYHVEKYNYNGVTVYTEKANLKKAYEMQDNNKSIVYELILHPDGILRRSWDKNSPSIFL